MNLTHTTTGNNRLARGMAAALLDRWPSLGTSPATVFKDNSATYLGLGSRRDAAVAELTDRHDPNRRRR